MQDFLLGVIALTLVILTIEISIVLYYVMTFLAEAIAFMRKMRAMQGNFESKIAELEAGLSLISGKLIRSFIKGLSSYFKK